MIVETAGDECCVKCDFFVFDPKPFGDGACRHPGHPSGSCRLSDWCKDFIENLEWLAGVHKVCKRRAVKMDRKES